MVNMIANTEKIRKQKWEKWVKTHYICNPFEHECVEKRE
jgi:hypothetical protein